MKISEFIELYKLIEAVTNNDDKIIDFGIIDETQKLYITTEKEKSFLFCIDK